MESSPLIEENEASALENNSTSQSYLAQVSVNSSGPNQATSAATNRNTVFNNSWRISLPWINRSTAASLLAPNVREAEGSATGGNEDNGTASSDLSNRVKQLLPFVILLILKAFMDHILHLLIVSIAIICLGRMQTLVEEQISLKSRSNPRTLLVIFAFGIFTLSQITLEMYALTKEVIWYRLGLITLAAANEKTALSDRRSSSFTSTIILVCITDISAMILLCMMKAIICLLIQSPYRLKREYLSHFICFPNGMNIHVLDAEVGRSRERYHDYHHHEQHDGPIDAPNESLVSGIIYDLVRRRHTNQINPIPSTIIPNSANSSDSSRDNEESSRFLLTTRILVTLDAIGLVYRSIVPMPIWLAYYSSGVGGRFFAPCYFIFKIFQVSNRIRDCIDVLKVFFRGTLEYGRYATDNDLRSATNECPICFDAISMESHPVLLDCKHMFCEVCILEWLNKEKTCPVCRTEVKCETPAIQEVKGLASESLALIV